MKIHILLSLATVTSLAACQSQSSARWDDMLTDIALRHKYERYSCGYRALEGFSKENACHTAQVSTPKRSKSESAPKPEQTVVSRPPPAPDRVAELSQKIDVLEEALTKNAAATNQNQALIVQEIKTLKSQMAELQTNPIAQNPLPHPETNGQ